MGTKHLIISRGWIGDILFTASIPAKLKELDPTCHVDFYAWLNQPVNLLKQNPFIDNVVMGPPDPQDITELLRVYDKVYHPMPVVRQDTPATIQFQQAVGIPNPTLSFDVWTEPAMDELAQREINALRAEHPGKLIVAFHADWESKTKKYTTSEYHDPNFHAPRRKLDGILNKIQSTGNVVLVQVGMPEHISQTHPEASDSDTYSYCASVLKHCDWMIGAEGGLTNLASAVGTRCIITTDHIWYVFGPCGRMLRFNTLQMGPQCYYPNAGHVHLDPFLTDDEVAQQIINHLVS